MSDHNIESHIKVYWNVFFALLAFTILTVGVSYIEFGSVFWTLFVGLGIACIKGYAVAGYFMHLNDERKPVYALLMLTIFYLFFLLFIPIIWRGGASKDTNTHLPYVGKDQYIININNEGHKGH